MNARELDKNVARRLAIIRQSCVPAAAIPAGQPSTFHFGTLHAPERLPSRNHTVYNPPRVQYDIISLPISPIGITRLLHHRSHTLGASLVRRVRLT